MSALQAILGDRLGLTVGNWPTRPTWLGSPPAETTPRAHPSSYISCTTICTPGSRVSSSTSAALYLWSAIFGGRKHTGAGRRHASPPRSRYRCPSEAPGAAGVSCLSQQRLKRRQRRLHLRQHQPCCWSQSAVPRQGEEVVPRRSLLPEPEVGRRRSWWLEPGEVQPGEVQPEEPQPAAVRRARLGEQECEAEPGAGTARSGLRRATARTLDHERMSANRRM